MTILFDATRPVKATRRPFGEGILRSLPVAREPYTQADLDWLAAQNAEREAFDRYIDRLGAEATAVGALELGLIPADLAGFLSSSSLIGHDG